MVRLEDTAEHQSGSYRGRIKPDLPEGPCQGGQKLHIVCGEKSLRIPISKAVSCVCCCPQAPRPCRRPAGDTGCCPPAAGAAAARPGGDSAGPLPEQPQGRESSGVSSWRGASPLTALTSPRRRGLGDAPPAGPARPGDPPLPAPSGARPPGQVGSPGAPSRLICIRLLAGKPSMTRCPDPVLHKCQAVPDCPPRGLMGLVSPLRRGTRQLCSLESSEQLPGRPRVAKPGPAFLSCFPCPPSLRVGTARSGDSSRGDTSPG